MPALNRRRWFRFSLRTMFVVVTVTCVWLGWQMYLVHQRKVLRAWLAWRDVTCSVEAREFVWRQENLLNSSGPNSTPAVLWPGIPWYRRMMGDEGLAFIAIPDDVPEDRRRQIAELFPEAFIEPEKFQTYNPPALIDAEFAEGKRLPTIEQVYEEDFGRLFLNNKQPPMNELLALAPRVPRDLIENLSLAFEMEIVFADHVVSALVTMVEMQTQVSNVEHSGKTLAAQTELAECLRKLQSLYDRMPRRKGGELHREYANLLIEYELERCAGRMAHLKHEPAEERAAVSRAVAISEKLWERNSRIWALQETTVWYLTGSLQRRCQAKLAAAELANNPKGVRTALREYGDALQSYRRQVELLYLAGSPGGEAEKYHLLNYLAAELAAKMAELDNDHNTARIAWQQAIDQANMEVEAVQAAYDGETVTFEAIIDAVNNRAAAREGFAKLIGDEPSVLVARQSHARVLFKLTNHILHRHCFACFVAPSMDRVDNAGCNYILARCRIEEAQGK